MTGRALGTAGVRTGTAARQGREVARSLSALVADREGTAGPLVGIARERETVPDDATPFEREFRNYPDGY